VIPVQKRHPNGSAVAFVAALAALALAACGGDATPAASRAVTVTVQVCTLPRTTPSTGGSVPLPCDYGEAGEVTLSLGSYSRTQEYGTNLRQALDFADVPVGGYTITLTRLDRTRCSVTANTDRVQIAVRTCAIE
jgi:hypothetical protein